MLGLLIKIGRTPSEPFGTAVKTNKPRRKKKKRKQTKAKEVKPNSATPPTHSKVGFCLLSGKRRNHPLGIDDHVVIQEKELTAQLNEQQKHKVCSKLLMLLGGPEGSHPSANFI